MSDSRFRVIALAGFWGPFFAACMSWALWADLGWAAISALLGWVYVFYWLIWYW